MLYSCVHLAVVSVRRIRVAVLCGLNMEVCYCTWDHLFLLPISPADGSHYALVASTCVMVLV